MIEEVKKLRVKIDGLAQLTKNLEKQITIVDLAQIPANQTVEQWLINFQKGIVFAEGNRKLYISSKEILKTIDSLYLAKAWLGKVLGELNVDSPYKSGYKTKEDIEPTADVAKEVEDFPLDNKNWGDNIENVSHIEKVDWLRQEIETLVEDVKHIPTYKYEISEQVNDKPIEWKATREFSIARTNAYNYLCEARFWLGFELQRIKEES